MQAANDSNTPLNKTVAQLMEIPMRILALSTALLAGGLLVAPVAEAKMAHHGKTMTVRLEGGKSVTFQLVRMHGRMMAIAPASDFDAFHHN